MGAMEKARARELLARERERIQRALADLEQPDPGRNEPRDASDDATELFSEELGEGIADRLRRELEAVERAEQRLAEGKYGLSIESGEPIPDARLEAVPHAERTVEEQARFEASHRNSA
jgi:DnaK suppressor protein